MSDQDELRGLQARASRARELLDDEILSAAFSTLEEGYQAAWRSTAIDDVAAREKLFLAVNIVGKIRDHLARVVADGRLAEVEIADLMRMAERRRRFGVN